MLAGIDWSQAVPAWAGGVVSCGFIYGYARRTIHRWQAAIRERERAQTITIVDDRLDVKLAPVLKRLDPIEAELRTNGGASMKDQLNRIDRRVEAIEQRTK